MKKKLTTLILITVLTMTINLTACKDPVDPPTGLTPEQQVQKMKDIYSGAYNAYFNKSVNPVNAFSVAPMNASSEEETQQIEGTFKFYLAFNTFLSQSIIEATGTDILINSYNLTPQFNLTDKFQDYKDNFPEETHETMESIFSQITYYEIYGQIEDTVYNKYVQTFTDGSVSASLIMEVKIEYKDDNEYIITVIATFPPELSRTGQEEIQVIVFDKQKGEIEFYNLDPEEANSNDIVKNYNTIKESFEVKELKTLGEE